MTRGISLYAFGHATSLFLAITFSVCCLGLIESYGYGWFLALIWVPLYNVFAARQTSPNRPSSKTAL